MFTFVLDKNLELNLLGQKSSLLEIAELLMKALHIYQIMRVLVVPHLCYHLLSVFVIFAIQVDGN